ncbi:hypothetical protein NVP2096O_01 [Vibrio phage 2.096.O._10N.286.48.B5]|nr:hypothetical protein NVP2096O_01 [Vibrio phage 2.096.O._10N.286.48.B5]
MKYQDAVNYLNTLYHSLTWETLEVIAATNTKSAETAKGLLTNDRKEASCGKYVINASESTSYTKVEIIALAKMIKSHFMPAVNEAVITTNKWLTNRVIGKNWTAVTLLTRKYQITNSSDTDDMAGRHITVKRNGATFIISEGCHHNHFIMHVATDEVKPVLTRDLVRKALVKNHDSIDLSFVLNIDIETAKKLRLNYVTGAKFESPASSFNLILRSLINGDVMPHHFPIDKENRTIKFYGRTCKIFNY